MNPYLKLTLKSFSVFVGAIGVSSVVSRAAGQISLFDGLAMFWPGIVALAAYWGGVADSTPAPWSQAQALVTATEAVQARQDARAVKDVLADVAPKAND